MEKISQINFLVNEMVQLNFKTVGNPLPLLSCQVNTTPEEDYLIPLDVCYVPIVFFNNRAE